MAGENVTLGLQLETNADSELQKVVGALDKAGASAKRLEAAVDGIAKSEVQLANIANKELRERVASRRTELQLVDQMIQKENALSNTIARGRSRRASIAGGGGGGGFLASAAGGLKGFGLAAGLGTTASAIVSGVSSGNTGQAIGGAIGGGLGTAANFIPMIGPIVSQILTPSLAQLGQTIGKALGGEDKGGKNPQTAALKEMVKEMRDAKKSQEAMSKELRRLVELGEVSAVEAARIAEIQGLQLEIQQQETSTFGAGDFADLAADIKAQVAATEEAEQTQKDIVVLLEAMVRTGELTLEQAQDVAKARGADVTGSDILSDPAMAGLDVSRGII